MTDEQPQNSRGNILVIGDELVAVQMLSSILTVSGYKVQSSTGGNAGLVMMQASLPDLALLQLKGLSIDSFALCQQLKRDTRTKDIPVIFVGDFDPTLEKATLDRAKIFQVGGTDYITQPCPAEELVARVENQLKFQRLQCQFIQQREQLQQEMHARTVLETALRSAQQELQHLTYLDRLTQVASRPYFDECLDNEWRRLTREQLPLSLIFCELDGFQHYSEIYGFEAGNTCLRRISGVLQSTIKRSGDLVARYSTEVFAILLPNTPLAGAVEVAKTMQSGVKQLQIEHQGYPVSQEVTLSIGVACIMPRMEGNPVQLVEVGQQELTQAKAEGCDRIVARDISPFPLLDYLVRNQVGLD
jgi:diguanylate cyclase (GGDEF)-like protein